MKRSILFLLGLLFFCLSVKAQIIDENISRQSALTVQYLAAQKSSSSFDTRNSKFVYSKISNRQYVNAFIKVNENLIISAIDELGVLVGTKAGNIWTVKIPIENIEALTKLESGVDFIQLDQPIYTNLDKALAKSKVDMVHNGVSLPQAFTGKDVVVGVLDVGFDYTHPTFYDEQGNNYRIKRIWEQKSIGTPPDGYSYGHEIVDQSDMIAQQTDNEGQSHGSHVAGIAAGSGFGGDGNSYKGVAYESDLVLVGITPAQDQWTNTGMTDIVDGLNYIFNYAASQGKPAIANLSWGCSIGPHDGSSLFSQAVDYLTGAGKIFTISAGNNGENKIHLSKEFTSSDSLLKSFVKFSSNLVDKKSWIDIWGEEGESFCVQFSTYNLLTPFSSIDFMCINNSTIDTFLIGSDNDTCFFKLTTVDADMNGKPHAFLDIHSKTKNNLDMVIKSKSGGVNVWMGYVLNSTGYYGEFSSYGQTGYTEGDTDMTIGEMGCTKSAITVGAYASKTDFTNLSGQSLSYNNYVMTERICPFSSKGPTSDGRSKPDITAPGMTLASAVNSFDNSYAPGGSSYSNVVHKYTDATTNQDYYFGESSGTSMSSPMTAGIIALILEERPESSPEMIKSILANTSVTDVYTTDNPDQNIWGLGKIDAHAIMQSFFVSGLDENKLVNNFVFPNPTNDILHIDIEGTKSVIVKNVIGETCKMLKTKEHNISLANLNSGIYLLSVYDQDNKLIINQKIVKF